MFSEDIKFKTDKRLGLRKKSTPSHSPSISSPTKEAVEPVVFPKIVHSCIVSHLCMPPRLKPPATKGFLLNVRAYS